MTVPVTDHVEDSTHKAAAKAVEQEHSKAIVVFERAKKRRQEQREEAATADATQGEMVRRQQTAGHYSLRSSPISTSASGTSNFFHTSAVFTLSACGIEV